MLHAEQLAFSALMFRFGLAEMATGWLMKLLKRNSEANLPDLSLCGYVLLVVEPNLGRYSTVSKGNPT